MKWIYWGLIAALCSSCKGDDSDNDDHNENYVSIEHTSEGTSSNIEEAMDILADTDQEGSSTLALSAGEIDITRACTVKDSSAVVNIIANYSGDGIREGRLATWSQTFSRTLDLTRTYSREGASIACTANNQFAALGSLGSDLTGLLLDITYKRTAHRTATTTLNNGTSKTATVASESGGTRSARWTGETLHSDGSLTRSKTVGVNGSRKVSYTQKAGKKDYTYSLTTSPEEPLALEVTFTSNASGVAKSRLVKSGVLVATTVGAGRIESTFENLLVEFSLTACEPKSGKITTRLFKEGDETPSHTVEAVASNGSYEVNDITDPANLKPIDDFEFTLCDVRSFNN